MRYLTAYTLQSIYIGSFLYLLFSIFTISGESTFITTAGIIGVWTASALIGMTTMIHHTALPALIRYGIQISVGIVAFITISVYLGSMNLTVLEILETALFIGITMLVIMTINYLLTVRDSKSINQKLQNHVKE